MRLGAWHVRNVWPLMKLGSNPVTNIFVHYTKPIISLDIIDDRFANHRDAATGRDGFNRKIQAIKRTLSDLDGLFVDFTSIANQKCL